MTARLAGVCRSPQCNGWLSGQRDFSDSASLVETSCTSCACELAGRSNDQLGDLDLIDLYLSTAVHRLLSFGVALFVICGHPLHAANPDDLEFGVRLTQDTHVYHMGEPIGIEISYSSQAEKKYHGSFRGPSPELEGVTPHVTPLDGVLDLRELQPDRGGWASSGAGGLGYLGPQPVTQKFDLCLWYRFQKPGHYSVVVTSTEVSRAKGAKEGGGKEQLTLESSPVELDILPADPVWVAGELSAIEEALDTARGAGERGVALYRLALLDTPASVQRLVQLYLANSEGGEDWAFDSGLHKSSQIDVIIPLLEASLSDPGAQVPSGLPQLLADLQTRRELGVMPVYPSDPASQEKWNEESKARSVVHDKYFAQANALLEASIERRSGPERATAIYQVWYNATQLNPTNPVTADVLSGLESNVLAVADALNHEQQVQFVILAWQSMPHEQLLPMVSKLAKETLTHAAGYHSNEAFELWCQARPEECGVAIIQDVIKSKAKTDMNVVLLSAEEEHPELDKMLEAQLKDPATLQEWGQSQRTAAVILRAGSRNIASAVDSFLDRMAKTRGCADETRGELLGYLFRVKPEDARKRLTAELQDQTESCGTDVLRTLHYARPSDDIVPIVTKALDSPNFTVAQSAALYLGDHGSASAEGALWRRLEALWSAWQGRSSELPDDMMIVGPDTKAGTAMLERALASALAHATYWTLSPAELDHLRAGCLTQTCRDIADGKMYLNL